ncbi:MAG: PadR family transcriptional regulator [Candidatus Aenigmarchaeota archaeon]|nr:PadR family transcriptional regulator [Candidatus Aenigmarchaeota archaeon]
MKGMRVDNLVKLYTLLLLQGRPKHGYELLKTTGERLGRNVSPGQMYPFLKRLQKLGYVRVQESGSREKKAYALTAKGKKFSQLMIGRFSGIMDLALKSRLRTCAHCGCEVYRGGYRKSSRNFCCRNCAQAYSG